MNLPNVLTLLRVAVIPIVGILFYLPYPYARQAACVFFALAAATDWVDGYLARKWGQTSKFGAFLDPVADKLLVAVSLVMLLEAEARTGGIMAILVAIIIGREITISALREWMAELGQRTSVAVGKVGKFKTAFQMIAIGMMIWHEPVWGIPVYQIGFGILFAAAALTLWSMLIYLRAAWPYLKEDHRVDS